MIIAIYHDVLLGYINRQYKLNVKLFEQRMFNEWFAKHGEAAFDMINDIKYYNVKEYLG